MAHHATTYLIHAVLTLLVLVRGVDAQPQHRVSSPDGDVSFAAEIVDGRLSYVARFRGEPVVKDGSLHLEFVEEPRFGDGIRIDDATTRIVDRSWVRQWGRRSEVDDVFQELTLTLAETGGSERQVRLKVRAYDDGIAYRYELPAAWGTFELSGEESVFGFGGNPTIWAANYLGFHASQESEFRKMSLESMSSDSVYGLPLLVRLDDRRWAAVTEADLTDWAGMWLTRGSRAGAVESRLAPHPDERQVAVRSMAPRSSPWRVILMSETPGAFLASDLIHNLNDPAEGDFSWVQPGIASWNWWNGPYLPDADVDVGMNTATIKRFVDLSAEMGWPYVLIDAGWYQAGPGPDGAERPGDITAVVPQLDLQEVIRYARERDVRPMLWMHWLHARNQMEEAFPLYESWGIAGVKIDFMDRDDQDMVNFYHDVARLAAEHRLLVDFHGAYKPTGVSRTYPNLITREGVLGSEYNKWSARVTPTHAVTIPFTRGILGEMDFTPGGFRNQTVADFQPRNTGPHVMGTRAHQLAMFVVYESALAVASDSPYSYHASPGGTDFLASVPTTWDDTHFIAGTPGAFVSVARRSGEAWFVGVMTNEQPRQFDLSLDFLGDGSYTADVWSDAYEAAEFPDRVLTERHVVTSADTLAVRMAPGGGQVVRLTPRTAP